MLHCVQYRFGKYYITPCLRHNIICETNITFHLNNYHINYIIILDLALQILCSLRYDYGHIESLFLVCYNHLDKSGFEGVFICVIFAKQSKNH